MSSRLIREDIKSSTKVSDNKITPIDNEVGRLYFKAIKKLPSTRHRNIALRVWNGDIMSRNRLAHMGLAEDAQCQHCGEVETQVHVVRDCSRAKRIWQLVNKENESDGTQDWLGAPFHDPELTLECMWHLLNSKDLTAERIFHRSTTFIRSLRDFKNAGQGDINISLLV